ncbi:glycosyltransferase [Brevibacillus laterosporus]|nr:glycosyltransferase family protein [Brevibacillus laterosporus]TPG69174.1 glycosyltransferase [Brevibacillus laterosporus]TPG90721.1 glycosyltransferase [Brevibacillus laterosporus]
MENRQLSFAFISCVNDHVLYKECLNHIRHLWVPPGFSVEIISIYDAVSMTEGYNRAMRQSKANYKIYLHQDTYIMNTHFLVDCLKVFMHKEVGMFGMAGTDDLPPSGAWWEGSRHFGRVMAYINSFGQHKFGAVPHPFQEVTSIDGVMMVTQYDLEWDENITNFHFYDTSQSLAFRKAGHKVVVPYQEDSWILHYCLDDINFEEYNKTRSIFLDHYRFEDWKEYNFNPSTSEKD